MSGNLELSSKRTLITGAGYRGRMAQSPAHLRRLVAGVFALTAAVAGPALAQDADPAQTQKLEQLTHAVDGLTSSARRGKCPRPPQTILSVNGSDVCDPDRANTHNKCDTRYSPSSKAWQDCYGAVQACRNKIDALNKGIEDYNKFVRLRCPPPKGTFTKMMPLPVVAAVPVDRSSTSSSSPGSSAASGTGSSSTGSGGAGSSSAAATSADDVCRDDSQTCMSACLNDRGPDSILSCNKDCTADSPGGKFCFPAQNVGTGGSLDR